jgi:hypothetical protein
VEEEEWEGAGGEEGGGNYRYHRQSPQEALIPHS